MVFVFNALAANLRHSHVWLSFGPVLERVLTSPAQHHITQPTPEALHFGTGEQDHERYLTVRGLIVTPFVDIGRKRFPGKTPKLLPSNGSDPYFSVQSASVTEAVGSPQ